MDIDTFVPVSSSVLKTFVVVMGCMGSSLPEDVCVIPWCLYLHSIVCLHKCGAIRHLEIVSKDEPDLWRSWVIAFEFFMVKHEFKERP